MPQIVLPREQAELVAQALEPVQVCDPSGAVLGVIEPIWTHDEIAEAKRRLSTDQPRYTTAQVLEHLRSLERK
jgi:hypothetical protein